MPLSEAHFVPAKESGQAVAIERQRLGFEDPDLAVRPCEKRDADFAIVMIGAVGDAVGSLAMVMDGA